MSFYVYAKSILSDPWGPPVSKYLGLDEAAEEAETITDKEGWWTMVADGNGVAFYLDYRYTAVGVAYGEAFGASPLTPLSTTVARPKWME